MALAPSLERRRLQLYLLQLLVDGAALLAGFGLSGWVYLGDMFEPSVWGAAQLLLPLFWTVALLNQTYSVEALIAPVVGLQRAMAALALAVILMIVLLFLARTSLTVSRFGFGFGFLTSLALLIWLRFNLQPRIRRWVGPRAINLLVIDDGGPQISLPNCLRIDAKAAQVTPSLDNPHALHRLATLIRNMDRVIVSCPPERRWAWAMVLKGGQMRGEIVDGEVNELGILGTSRAEGVGTLVVASGPLGLRSRALKRGLDLAITIPALLVLGPLLLVVAALVHLEPDLPSNVNRGYYIQPTVFSDVTPDMRIAQEEIFGPVVTLMAYDSLDQAIDMANDTEYGLSAAISGDPAKAAPVAAKLRAGMVAINNWGPTPGAPFGGYKQSGNGREGGLAGLKDFMEMKAISGLPA